MMNNRDIQGVLDDLDLQLVSGKIDMATYRTLTVKWSAKLSEASAGSGGTAAATAPAPVSTVKIACPNCGAPPAEDLAAGVSAYTCPYCAFQFTVERAAQETEKLKKELQGWLSQMVSGVSAGSAVDATSRAFIFKEKLYPSLDLEFNRSLEWLDGFREYPLFSTTAGQRFPEYALESNPLRIQRERLSGIRNLSAKLSAPAVREFVIGPAEERRLTRMQCRATELIYTSNLIEQSSRFNTTGYTASRENLEALKNLYADARDAAEDPAESRFLDACITRLGAAQVVMESLARIYGGSGEFMGSNVAAELESATRAYEEAIQLADGSGHSPMDTIPWRNGVEKELALVGLQTALLNSYDRAVANRGGSFFEFQDAVIEFAGQSGATLNAPADLAVLAAGLTEVLGAQRGSSGLPRLSDWSWLEATVEGSRRKKTMFVGVNENVSGVDRYWQPFWLASLSFSQSEGAIFKSGASKQALLMMDATSAKQACCTFLEEGHPLRGSLESAARCESVDSALTLPMLTGETAALKVLESFARSNPVLRNAKVTMVKVIYLPAAEATYNSKEGQRRQAFSVVGAFNSDTLSLRESTGRFIRRCSN